MYEICCMRATYFSKMCCMCATLYELDFGAVLGHVATVRNRPVRDSKSPERGQRQVSTPPLRTAAAFSRLQFQGYLPAHAADTRHRRYSQPTASAPDRRHPCHPQGIRLPAPAGRIHPYRRLLHGHRRLSQGTLKTTVPQ